MKRSLRSCIHFAGFEHILTCENISAFTFPAFLRHVVEVVEPTHPTSCSDEFKAETHRRCALESGTALLVHPRGIL